MDTSDQLLTAVRREIRSRIGASELASLHRASAFLDVVAILAALLAFAAVFAMIARIPTGLVLVPAVVLQAWVLTIIGLLNHDVFVHRRLGGLSCSRTCSIILTLPLLIKSNGYTQSHLAHHNHLGMPEDPEIYKQDLTTRWRKLLFCTVVGIQLAATNRFGDRSRPGYFDVRNPDPALLQSLRLERSVRIAFLSALVAATVLFPRAMLLGYLVPALVVVPVLNTLRIIIEHADQDIDNAWSTATFYRTGIVSRVAFLWDSGDCHAIHHLYPAIPFYRMGRALRLMRPLFIEHGVVERRNYAALVWQWFAVNALHRTSWST